MWRWGAASCEHIALSDGPIEKPTDWIAWVNAPQTHDEEQAMQKCLQREQPYGTKSWCDATGMKLGLATSVCLKVRRVV